MSPQTFNITFALVMIALIGMLLLAAIVTGLICRLNKKLEKEIYRNRILQAFIAGTVRTVSDYKGLGETRESPVKAWYLPLPYRVLLDNVEFEFFKGMPVDHYRQWVKTNENLFVYEPKVYCNDDGFNFIYLDFFNRLKNRTLSEQSRKSDSLDLLNRQAI